MPLSMSTRASSFLGAALGQIRYRFALGVIGFGVFFGWLLACAIPLCIYASYSDVGGTISDAPRWTLTGVITLITAVLTYRCRDWIVRKASEEAPPEPVSGMDFRNAGVAVVRVASTLIGSLVAVIGTLVALMVAGFLVYGGYLLLTMLSEPMAILIGAIIIALAVLGAASL